VSQQAGNQNSQNKSDAEKKWEIWRQQWELEKQQKAASKASAQIEHKRERPFYRVTPPSKTFASSSTPDVEPQKPTIENPNVSQQAGNQSSQNKIYPSLDAETKWKIWRQQRELEKQQKAASKASAQIEQQETIPIESPEKKVPVTVGHKKNEYGEKIVAILFGWVFVIILGIIFPLSLGLTLFLMVSWTRQVMKDF
jgi:hypothetical protein